MNLIVLAFIIVGSALTIATMATWRQLLQMDEDMAMLAKGHNERLLLVERKVEALEVDNMLLRHKLDQMTKGDA